MKQLSDSELINLAKDDNEEAKEELYKRSKEVISYSIGKYKSQFWSSVSKSDVEDLVSECNIAVMEAIKLYQPDRGSGFPHFLKFVIRTRLYKWVGKKIEIEQNVIPDTKLERLQATPDIRTQLLIRTSNDKEKRIVDLYLAGMIPADIAREMQLTKAWIGRVIKRCIK